MPLSKAEIDRIKLLQQGVDPETIDEILGPAPEEAPDLPYVDPEILARLALVRGKRVENLTPDEIREAATNPPEPFEYVTVQDKPPFVPSTFTEARTYRAQQLGVDERNLTDINLDEARKMIVRRKKPQSITEAYVVKAHELGITVGELTDDEKAEAKATVVKSKR